MNLHVRYKNKEKEDKKAKKVIQAKTCISYVPREGMSERTKTSLGAVRVRRTW